VSIFFEYFLVKSPDSYKEEVVKYGERLRELRAERQLSLRQVEERGGPNKDTMSLLERGVHKPHAQTLGRIAIAFGMSVAELRAELEAAEHPKQGARSTRKRRGGTSFNYLNPRDIHVMQQAADLQAQLERYYVQAPQYYDVHDLLEEQRRIERDMHLQPADILQDVLAAEQLRHTLGANHLDIQRAAQEALNQHERIQDVLGTDALETATWLAEQQASVSLEAERVAQITEQLDVNYLTRTLKQAQQLLSESTASDLLDQANIQAIIRDAEAAMDAARAEPGEFTGEVAVGPPEWMRHLSRENLVTLIKLLIIYVQTIQAIYDVSLALSDGNVSETEVDALVQVLLTALGWAYYVLNNRKDDD